MISLAFTSGALLKLLQVGLREENKYRSGSSDNPQRTFALILLLFHISWSPCNSRLTKSSYFLLSLKVPLACLNRALQVRTSSTPVSSFGSLHPHCTDTVYIPAATQAVTPYLSKYTTVGYACVNADKQGPCGYINVPKIPSGCRNFVGSYDNKVSSLMVLPQYKCDFFL
jgi:hypothetical protein